MAKNKKQDNALFNLIGFILVAVGLVLWFMLSPLKYESGGLVNITQTFSYLNGSFGLSQKILGVNVEILKFSILNLIPLVLMILLAITSLAGFLNPKMIKDKNLKLLTHILVLVTIILLLLFKQLLVPAAKDADFSEHKLTVQAFIIPVLLLGTSALQFFKK